MGLFDDMTISTLTASMRGLELRQTAIAQNIANAETPGYRRIDVAFEDQLAAAVAEESAGDAPGPAGLPVAPFALARLNAMTGGMEMALQTPSGSEFGPQAIDQFTASLTVDGTTYMRYDGSSVDPDQEMALLAANQLAYQTVTQFLTGRFNSLSYAINGR